MPAPKHRLTPMTRRQIIGSIHSGGYPHVAAQAWGVPRDVFDTWMAKGAAPRAREPYASFAREVQEGHAKARLIAETNLFQKEPKIWLEHGPGRETQSSRGWSAAVKPAEATAASTNPFLDPRMMLFFSKLLALLAPYPDVRSQVGQEFGRASGSPGS